MTQKIMGFTLIGPNLSEEKLLIESVAETMEKLK